MRACGRVLRPERENGGQTSPVTFRLQLPEAVNIHPIFHVGLLKPYVGRESDSKPLPAPDKSGEYEIEKILGQDNRTQQRARAPTLLAPA